MNERKGTSCEILKILDKNGCPCLVGCDGKSCIFLGVDNFDSPEDLEQDRRLLQLELRSKGKLN